MSLIRSPVTFHQVCGDNVAISADRRTAKRGNVLNALVFSARPIDIGEVVVVKLGETTTTGYGFIRVGITNHDPETFRNNLPKYAIPLLTERAGNWANALAADFACEGRVVHFYVTSSGQINYGVDGRVKGIFLEGVNASLPMWFVIDLYGNSTGVEFLDVKDIPFGPTTPRPIQPIPSYPRQNEASSSSDIHRPTHCPTYNPQSQQRTAFIRRMNPSSFDLNQQFANGAGSSAKRSLASSSSSSSAISFQPTSLPPLRYNVDLPLVAIEFSSICRNVILSPDKFIATRNQAESLYGYVFIKRQVRTNEKIIVQVLKVIPECSGSLGFGITSCDPNHINPSSLPEDADSLLDRVEYWVVNKNVASGSAELDELTFSFNENGEVHFQRNYSNSRIIMHIDHTQRLFFFFNIFGSTLQIRLVGSVRLLNANSAYNSSNFSSSVVESDCSVMSPESASSDPVQLCTTVDQINKLPDNADGQDECCVCRDKKINCALYTCGHMCMCYVCAMQTWQTLSTCPLCKMVIKDVIKTYKT